MGDLKILNQFLHYLGEIPNITRLSVFSPACYLCDNTLVSQGEEIICDRCADKIHMSQVRCCKKCGIPVKRSQYLCGHCLIHPPRYKKHLSYTFYEGIMKDLIILFKFGEVAVLKRLLAGCLLDLYEKKMDSNHDFVIPVPGDKSRKRSFNPILELTEWVSKMTGIPLLKKTLIKKRPTVPQVGLGYSHRIRNLKGAFGIKDSAQIDGKKILLIDDVYTTGTTINECIRVLARAGAEVSAMTLARSLLYG